MTDHSDEIGPVDNGCVNGCNAPFGIRCSVCNTEGRTTRPARRSGNVGDHLDQVLQRQLSVECCCSVEDGGTYCGQPECDIYYCHDCGDEFSEPCIRHEGVDHA